MKFVVKTGKTVEDALQEALLELKATEKDVEIGRASCRERV